VGNALGRKREKGGEKDRTSHSVAVDDRPDRVEVRVDMPPVKKTDVSVGHEDGSLVVSACTASSNGRSHRRSQLTHEIPLGEGLEWDNAHARLKNGVLTVQVPRAQIRGSGPETIRVK
jgi:HSP20 family molecular chaperone IbpA